MNKTAKCKSCGAAIAWVKTVGGASMPLDAEPHPEGNVQVIGPGQVRVLTKSQLAARPAGPLYRSHFVTCPNSRGHRKKA